MKFLVITYGCQMNVRDSEAVSALLMRQGYVCAEGEADADVIVINTCSVRGKAEAKALGKLGLLVADSRRNHPDRVVGVMGCMVQRLGPALFEKVPGLGFGIGTQAMSRLPLVLQEVFEGKAPVLDVGDGDDAEALTGHVEGHLSAFVNILLGCDRRCTYCIVPHVRGREWSRPAESVVDEVRELVGQGVREVTLLGQSVMNYGRRNPVWPEGSTSAGGYETPFPRLLEAVDAVVGIERVRFTSGHPSGCTPELVRAMAELPTVCEHLHLPCQSGSDPILERMRRGYTVDQFRQAARVLQAAVPGVALSTDIIVGFPGETEEDFERTRAFMEEIGFDNAFIFKYSPRSGTPAAEWDDDVSDEEKMRRNQVLLEDQTRRVEAINKALVGQRVNVLVEGPSLRNAARWSGRSRTNKVVVFEPIPGVERGDCVELLVERVTATTLYAVGSVRGA
ncbi:MAG: tRNA (N6-isopentenyl adenosine(37)-C2)-methylthiotransferase MiaB [Kiritimatiellia bacterium]|nr:tRNA (N6-isopentenyl adenosine(37)-C2)-methylthiotransferase MiaB [Kiritimatiellia bacterium]MDP6630487.1 tRNA (N6-isopentenyl adenosine(37)-C2)-methylthiotransferase MiaB [Kiritimatiellia bacterium]MDP6809944.1 tRNA (N6-isopentenyl adenosine(37)-C2)-methylthiotransferase MiaB [Kiritimatiellia bacterium]MDP7025034.1 tRNA (N6-isopentenyl adenosine(37)-C2)-methylthiotransferase MiaB [Kiritimatiellia bacterium]